MILLELQLELESEIPTFHNSRSIDNFGEYEYIYDSKFLYFKAGCPSRTRAPFPSCK